jgi:hypothetical protein
LDTVKDGHEVQGRADFIIKRIKPYDDLVILDGKGSKHREQYVDKEQLIWYAYLYQRRNNRLPERLGFIFWRFEPTEAVDWLDFSSFDVASLSEDIDTTLSSIEHKKNLLKSANTEAKLDLARELFPVQPEKFQCKFCRFSSVCIEGQIVLNPNKLKPEPLADDEDTVFL